jgi:predicted nucleic acid-binding protein
VIVYLDSSVILRVVLKEPNELDSWYEIDHGITSELTIVECHRTLYRANASGRLNDSGFQLARNYADQILLRLTIVNITSELIEKAAGPLPGALATLDAIHLVSAMDYRGRLDDDEPPLSFGTHDHALAVAAALSNFPVLGTVLGA